MSTSQNFQHYFRSLQILFFALLLGQVIFCITLWFIQKPSVGVPEFQKNSWSQGVGLFSLGLVVASYIFRKKLVERAKAQQSISARFTQYRMAQSIGWALAEAATLVNMMFYFTTGNMQQLYMAAACLLFFATQVPLRNKLENELELSASEQGMLDDPNASLFGPPNTGE